MARPCPVLIIITIDEDSEKFHPEIPLRIPIKKSHNTDDRHFILGGTAIESFLTSTLLQHLRAPFEGPFEEFIAFLT